MRLIDADAFIEDIKTEIVNLALDGLKGTPRPREELYQIIDRIGEQPTAYDVEKVVKQLEDNAVEFELFGISSDYVPKHIAIASVRNGGKE